MYRLETKRLVIRDHTEDDLIAYHNLCSDSQVMKYLSGKLVEAGYFTRKEFWGNGYTTEAFVRVIQHAFQDIQVHKLSCRCLAEKLTSERVMQECVLTKEAHLQKYQWYEDELRDRIVYRILKSEWLELHE